MMRATLTETCTPQHCQTSFQGRSMRQPEKFLAAPCPKMRMQRRRSTVVKATITQQVASISSSSSMNGFGGQECPFSNVLVDGCYVPPSFVEKLSLHVTKNVMDIPGIPTPLILGIWGPSGQGKTHQAHLACKALGVRTFSIPGWELFNKAPVDAARLILRKYLKAADSIARGEMAALYISDICASGLDQDSELFSHQRAIASILIDLADHPTWVQLPGSDAKKEVHRVPIICTGNNFRMLYGPLINAGRFEKYQWSPSREDMIGICMAMFDCEDLSAPTAARLVDTFPNQPVRFYAALKDIFREKLVGWQGADILEALVPCGQSLAIELRQPVTAA